MQDWTRKDGWMWLGIGLLACTAFFRQLGTAYSVWTQSDAAERHASAPYQFADLAAPSPLMPPQTERVMPALNLHEATRLLVDAIILIESDGNPLQVGSSGERGLMQLMPGTWGEVSQRHFGAELSFDRAFDPILNRRMGTCYLGEIQELLYTQRRAWRSDLRSLILASYNAGPHAVRRAGFDVSRMSASVQDYVQRAGALHDWRLAHRAVRLQRVLELASAEK